MMVIFVSQCEKNALNKTRRVLDSFANRIGDKTWQTIITNEGLNAVKKSLRKTASKNTAVSCHWLRSRSRSELVWIVGDRRRFNSQGIVPVNITQKNIIHKEWENDWHYLPLIKSLAALAALFHDWGKASVFFQDKLRLKKIISDPLRHEWVSVLFLNAFVGGDTDEQWLTRLANDNVNENSLKDYVRRNTRDPLSGMPPAASSLAWLMVSHHRLPLPDEKDRDNEKGNSLEDFESLFKLIKSNFGYQNNKDEKEYRKKEKRCLTFSHALPCGSKPWLKQAKKWAGKMLSCLPLLEKAIDDGGWRVVLHHARLSLMLGDHYYSSQGPDPKFQIKSKLYANTYRQPVTPKLKQTLEEHLIGVASYALKTAHSLPNFEKGLPEAVDINKLKKSRRKKFDWQDKAADKIKEWREKLPDAQKDIPQGFFLVNMAGTGYGKTFANAKIMRALSRDGETLRYVLALGLRTLTLQTGDEYRERIGLDYTELAVIIGSKEVKELHQQNKAAQEKEMAQENEMAGSESEETLLDEEIIYDKSPGLESALDAVLPDQKSRKLLYAPVLVCTIDHLMGATETTRGGRYILPNLRLMSSDLVIDEVDDFDGNDLIAIGRLIHLAGMLGRKVMISSATIPPNLAEGYFNAYREGWRLFAKIRDADAKITCAWIDEFNSRILPIYETNSTKATDNYKKEHSSFIEKRVKNIGKEKIRRKGEITSCADIKTPGPDHENNIEDSYFAAIQKAIIANHTRHKKLDEDSRKYASFGVARVANIKPCAALARYLAETAWPENIDVRVMAYHSQQVMLLRSEQEKHLDSVLRRDKNENAPLADPLIKKHLSDSKAENLIFIVVATPVEEIGRDHDFDWAVIEPSSFRSIIQLAGRVLRHRDLESLEPNISIMRYNLKGLKQSEDDAVFLRPGYEKNAKGYLFSSHDMTKLIDEDAIKKGINAIPRIQRNKELKQNENFADLEHFSIERLLTTYENRGPEAMQGWLTGYWWLTALPQLFNRFRKGSQQKKLFLIPNNAEFSFMEKGDYGNHVLSEKTYSIEQKPPPEHVNKKLWLDLDYESLLLKQAEAQGISYKDAALKYGEISFRYKDALSYRYEYSTQFGLIRFKNN